MDILTSVPMSETGNEIAAFLCGSQSYGLAREGSDHDWRVLGFSKAQTRRGRFTEALTEAPAFLSLCGRKEHADCGYMPLAHLVDSAKESTLYNLNPFFSSEVLVSVGYEDFIQAVLEKRERIAKMNLPHLRVSLALEISKAYNRALNTPYTTENKAMMRCLFYCDIFWLFAQGETFWNCVHPIESRRVLYLSVLNGTMPEMDARKITTKYMARNDKPEILNFYKRAVDEELCVELSEMTRDFLANHNACVEGAK